MKIFVKVKVKARAEKVEKLGDTNFKVSLKEAPEKGKANLALIKALAKYFKVSQGDIRIVSGSTARLKIVEVKNGKGAGK